MNDVALETIRALILLGLLSYLWNVGNKRNDLKNNRGWRLIFFGFLLMFFGTVLDITDNFDSLNRYLIIGDTEAEAFLEKIVGYLGGVLLIASGFLRWLPTIIDTGEKNRLLHELDTVNARMVDNYEKLQDRTKDMEASRVALLNMMDDMERTETALAERVLHSELGADVGAALISGETVRKLLQGCAGAIAGRLDIAFARIWTLNEEANVLELQASAGMYTHTDGVHSRVPVGELKIGLIAEERKPHITNSVIGDPRVKEQEWARREGMAAFAGYPLVIEGKLLGVLAVFARKPLSDSTVKALSSYSDTIALGILRKNAEQAQRETEEKNRAILNAAVDGIMSIDDRGTLQSFNPAAERIFGYTVEEVIGKNISMLMPSPYQEEHDGYLENYRNTGEKKIIGIGREVEGLRKDGTRFPLYLSVSETVLGQKRLFTGMVQDITERKKAEEDLRESEMKFRSVTQSANDAIISADSTGNVISWNKGAQQIFGYTEEEAFGMPLAALIPDRYIKAYKKEIERFASTGTSKVLGKTMELHGRRSDGAEFPIDISLSAWTTDEGSFFTSIIRDITERKQAEREIKKAHEAALADREKAEVMALEAENANRAKSEFLSSMSHEIRTPMNAIIGMADLLSETNLTQEQEKYVNTYRYAGENLLNIINDILDLSKIESGHLVLERTGFDLQELIERTCEIMAIQAQEKSIELANLFTSDLPCALLGDPTRLRQVIINLAGNAIKFTEKGEVVIGVEAREIGKEEVELLFFVKDTGIGIPREKLGTIFESFSQADSSTTRKFGGTGLGLSISMLIVELMGGKIWVESDLGKGSTFYFTAKLERDKRSGKCAETGAMDLNGVRVLIVDDNETNRMILTKTLSGWGADTEEAVDGKSCLDELVNAKKSGRQYDLVLLDFVMPNMDGLEVAEKVKGDLEINVPIIIITSSSGAGRGVKRLKKFRFDGYIDKPVKQSELRTNINIALGRAKRTKTKSEKRQEIASNGVPLKILLVEDNRDNRNLILAYLKKSQHGIDVAENGRIAVDKFSSGAYDFVLMDMQMPVMDGYDATRAIRKWEKENGVETTPIIALTAHALKDDEVKSFEAGCDGHLTKPIKKKKLLEAISRYAATPP